MPKAIIKQMKLMPVKYHGQVSFVDFECNSCHRTFTKKESYFNKQLKKRPSACSFCSPSCRSKYFFDKSPSKDQVIEQKPESSTEQLHKAMPETEEPAAPPSHPMQVDHQKKNAEQNHQEDVHMPLDQETKDLKKDLQQAEQVQEHPDEDKEKPESSEETAQKQQQTKKSVFSGLMDSLLGK